MSLTTEPAPSPFKQGSSLKGILLKLMEIILNAIYARSRCQEQKNIFIVCQLTNKHPEKHIMYSVKLREVFPNGVSASSRYEPRPFHRYQWRRFSPPPEDRIPEDHLELRQTLWHLRRKYSENFSATSIFLQLSVYNKTAGFARFILTLFMPLTFHKPATITSDRTRYFSNRYCMI